MCLICTAGSKSGRSPRLPSYGELTCVLHSTANGRSKTLKGRRAPAENVAEEGRSSQVTVAADMVFSMSKNLSGVSFDCDVTTVDHLTMSSTAQSAIVDFVKALSEVSWEEIQSSSQAQQPRLFSLQKLVEISYYNMSRIRLEWSNMWAILGDHFNQVSRLVQDVARKSLTRSTARFAVTITPTSVSSPWMHFDSLPCASWRRMNCRTSDSKRIS